MAIVMISRGAFSGGKIVAEALASRLKYPCISNEVIDDAAETFGISGERLNSVMQEPPRSWRQRPGRRLAHMNFIRAALLRRAMGGNLVYYGYAGHLLLSDLSQVLRVRIIADLEYRLKTAMENEGIGRDEAIEKIQRIDRMAEKWTQALYGVQWQDPFLYDVVLNLNGMRLESVVSIIAHMTELPDFKTTPETIKTLDDLLLGSLVRAELAQDKATGSANIRVNAHQGVVTIRGKAGSHKIVGVIPVVAGRVQGVKEIKNELGKSLKSYGTR